MPEIILRIAFKTEMMNKWTISIGILLAGALVLFIVNLFVQSHAIGNTTWYVFSFGLFLIGFCLIRYTDRLLTWEKNRNIRFFQGRNGMSKWLFGTTDMKSWYEDIEPGWHGIWKFFVRATGFVLMIPLIVGIISGILWLAR